MLDQQIDSVPHLERYRAAGDGRADLGVDLQLMKLQFLVEACFVCLNHQSCTQRRVYLDSSVDSCSRDASP